MKKAIVCMILMALAISINGCGKNAEVVPTQLPTAVDTGMDENATESQAMIEKDNDCEENNLEVDSAVTYSELDSDILESYYINLIGLDSGEVEYKTDSMGNIVEIYLTLSDRILLTATYDDNGRVSTITDSMGFTKLYERNEGGQKTKITHGNTNGEVTAYTMIEYDSSNRRISDLMYDANMNLLSQEMFVYDTNGNRVEYLVKDASGNLYGEEKYEYDQLGRIIGTLFSEGIYIKYIYDNDNFSRMEEYDSEGNLLATDYDLYFLTGNLYEILDY